MLLLYRLCNGRRRWRLGRILLQLVLRLEGGGMYSATARQIMRESHGVAIGPLSYGHCFDPAVIPPGVQIGNYVSIAPNARFFVQNHPLDTISTHPVFYEDSPGVAETNCLPPGQLVVGHDVWIGYNAVVTPGCSRIGNGAVIAAGAVVTKDVPDYAVVAGNPAQVLRSRLPEESQAVLQASRWWEKGPAAAKLMSHTLPITSPEGETKAAIASVIIPAHNEASVIRRCLDGLLANSLPGEVEIIVVGNGCDDDTCDIARGYGDPVRVLETPAASKVEALNMGDRTACYFPRFYVDADVQIDIDAIRATVRTLSRSGVKAASPRVEWDLRHRGWAVKSFYRVWALQPYFDDGRLGSGVYALNEAGHERLSQFPDVTADDEYVRQLFEPSERRTAPGNSFLVTPPATLGDLVRIKTRSRRGTQQLKQHFAALNRDARQRRWAFAMRLAVRIHLWPSAIVYFAVVAMTLVKARQSRHMDHKTVWERDRSSRRVVA
ncbi:MAG: glycosyltransferase [Aureliella sp.]